MLSVANGARFVVVNVDLTGARGADVEAIGERVLDVATIGERVVAIGESL